MVDIKREMDFDKKEIENLDFIIEEDNKKFKSYFNID